MGLYEHVLVLLVFLGLVAVHDKIQYDVGFDFLQKKDVDFPGIAIMKAYKEGGVSFDEDYLEGC
jgi:hypothetical protein